MNTSGKYNHHSRPTPERLYKKSWHILATAKSGGETRPSCASAKFALLTKLTARVSNMRNMLCSICYRRCLKTVKRWFGASCCICYVRTVLWRSRHSVALDSTHSTPTNITQLWRVGIHLDVSGHPWSLRYDQWLLTTENHSPITSIYRVGQKKVSQIIFAITLSTVSQFP